MGRQRGIPFVDRYRSICFFAETAWDTFLWLVVDVCVLRRRRGILSVARHSCMRLAEATWDATSEYRGKPGDTAGRRGIPWDTAGYRGMPPDAAGRAGLSTSQLLLDMCMYKGTDSCTTLPYIAAGY